MALLAAGCLGLGLASPQIFSLVLPTLAQVAQVPLDLLAPQAAQISSLLHYVSWAFGALLALVTGLLGLRAWLLPAHAQAQAVTWDCGFDQPTPRMQYTASSFVGPLTNLFRIFLRTRKRQEPPQGIFPTDAALRTETPPVFFELIFVPIFQRVAWALSKMRWLQHGRVQLYVLYIALALAALLTWKLRP